MTDKPESLIKFKLESDTMIQIVDAKTDEKIGRIFTPSASDNGNSNCIQVCGFTEAFDYWGCGVYTGKRDIQLLFDDKIPEGTFDASFDNCQACFMTPCVCERNTRNTRGELCSPFIVKREQHLLKRIVRDKPRITLEEVEKWNKKK